MATFILLGSILVVHLLALISPGPDFIMICRNSLIYSKKTGIYTAVGLGAGTAVHTLYSIAGLALVISKSIIVFNLIKYAGALYLVYIGIKSIKSSGINLSQEKTSVVSNISSFQAIKMGFLTNVLNPKATLFFLSLFTLILSPETPTALLIIASVLMVMNTVIYFSIIAIVLNQTKVRSLFERYQTKLNKTLGVLLIGLGIKVALSK